MWIITYQLFIEIFKTEMLFSYYKTDTHYKSLVTSKSYQVKSTNPQQSPPPVKNLVCLPECCACVFVCFLGTWGPTPHSVIYLSTLQSASLPKRCRACPDLRTAVWQLPRLPSWFPGGVSSLLGAEEDGSGGADAHPVPVTWNKVRKSIKTQIQKGGKPII